MNENERPQRLPLVLISHERAQAGGGRWRGTAWRGLAFQHVSDGARDPGPVIPLSVLYQHVHTHVCTHMCTHALTYTHAGTHVRAHTCMHTHMRTAVRTLRGRLRRVVGDKLRDWKTPRRPAP